MIQLPLAFFGLTALWLAMGKSATGKRWAPLVGLAGQPFWFIFALQAQPVAWGLIALVVAYTVVYARGAWVQWRSS